MSVDFSELVALRRAGRLAEAEALARHLLESHPREGGLWIEIALLFSAAHSHGKAEAAYRQALELLPDSVAAHLNLAVLLVARDQDDEALAHFERAAQLAPDNALVLSNLGAMLRKRGQLERARVILESSLQKSPTQAGASLNLGLTLADQGDAANAMPYLEAAVARAPDRLDYHDSLLLQMHHLLLPATEIAAAHDRYGRQAAARHPARTLSASDRDCQRTVRVGLVSADLRRHSVAYFLAPIVAHNDARELQLFAYSNAPREDDRSAEFAHQLTWRRVFALTDEALAAQIAADQIDVLIDLSGHSAGNRLPLFARRAAPVQLSYLGYPDRTGLGTIDARLTDRWADPDSDSDSAGESLLYLDGGFLYYAPPAESPAIKSRVSGPLTFGCFNVLNKISDAAVLLWAQLLVAAPQARLFLKSGALDDGATAERLLARLQQQGISRERVQLAGHLPMAQHLAAYHSVDLALDTFPYHGTTTTCDALYMGVPVVTLAGATHVSRVGVSLLSRAGLPELIARTPADYVRIAVELAGDAERRAHWRAHAREQLYRGGITDGVRGAKAFAAAIRQAWWRYLAAS